MPVIQLFKVRLVHDHFAAHFDHFRDGLGVHHQRNRADRADVRGNVFADGTVTARGGRGETAVHVMQIDRKAVKLEFTVVLNGTVGVGEVKLLSHAPVKGKGPLGGEVRFRVNGEHRHTVRDFGEVTAHFAPHTLCGRMRRL